MKKSMVIFLIVIMIFSSLGAISATTPARNHTNSAQCYSCNDSSQCYCDDNCLCKDPNYIQKIGGVNKIRNNDSCYRCNETCYCPDNCSCKQPYSAQEIEESKEYMNYENNFFVKTFRGTPFIYIVNIIYVNTHHLKNPHVITNDTPNGTNNITNGTNTTGNTTINNTNATADNGTNTTAVNDTSDNGSTDSGNTNTGNDGSSGDTSDSGNTGDTSDSGNSNDASSQSSSSNSS